MKKLLLLCVFAPFSALTVAALMQHGYLGIIFEHFKTFAGMQVFADLVIALGLFIVWMWHDAKKNNRNFYPWFLLVITTGSIGALVYLFIYKTGKSQ